MIRRPSCKKCIFIIFIGSLFGFVILQQIQLNKTFNEIQNVEKEKNEIKKPFSKLEPEFRIKREKQKNNKNKGKFKKKRKNDKNEKNDR